MVDIACPCGCAQRPSTEQLATFLTEWIEELGPTMTVANKDGAWNVPRTWLMYHGLKSAELADLAKRFGWGKVEL